MKKTCHDDGWPREDTASKAEHHYAQITSIDNYILNEIKSQEDAATQLMIIDSALIGIYLAFMMNSQSLEAIRATFRIIPIPREVLLIPICAWFLSGICCSFVLKPKIKNIDVLINKYRSLNCLKNIADDKHKWLQRSCISMAVGFVLVIFIAFIAIPYQITGIAETWKNKGDALFDQGKYNESIQEYDKAIEIYPQNEITLNKKGFALKALGKYYDAINAFNEAIKVNPQYSAAWNNKGDALMAQGKYNDAIECYNKTIEIDAVSHDYYSIN